MAIPKSYTSGGCSPVSSNCVEWEGGKIPLIPTSDNDTVSSVIVKSMIELEKLKKSFDIADLDLSPIYEQCSACPEPSKDYVNIIKLILEKFNELDKSINPITSDSGENYFIIDTSFFREDDGSFIRDEYGQVITKLPTNDYIRFVITYFISKLRKIQNTSVTKEEFDRTVIGILNQLAEVNKNTTVMSVGVVPGASPENPLEKETDEFIELFEKDYIKYRNILGKVDTLAKGISNENSSTDSEFVYKLANKGEVLWTKSATTIGESIDHIWSAIKDIRTSVKLMMDTYFTISCDRISVDFDVKRIVSGISSNGIRLFFNGRSVVPSGFEDFNTDTGEVGTRFTITDELGNTYKTIIPVASQINDPNGFYIDLDTTPLAIDSDLIIEADVVLKNEEFFCTKCLTKKVELSKDTACDYCTITGIGDPSSNQLFTIIYED